VIGILDVLPPIIASAVARDDRLIATDEDAVGIGLDGHAGAGVLSRHRVAVGIQADAELARGTQGEDARHIVGRGVQRMELGALFLEEIDGSSVCLAVDAHVGDGVEPDARSGVDGAEVSELEAVQEVFLDVADARLDAALLVSGRHVTGADGETGMPSVIEISGVEDRGGTGEALQHGAF
jgi:hypothetical protein